MQGCIPQVVLVVGAFVVPLAVWAQNILDRKPFSHDDEKLKSSRGISIRNVDERNGIVAGWPPRDSDQVCAHSYWSPGWPMRWRAFQARDLTQNGVGALGEPWESASTSTDPLGTDRGCRKWRDVLACSVSQDESWGISCRGCGYLSWTL